MTETQKDHFERINRVLQYIHHNLHETIDLEGLARRSNYSIFHFHRIMSAHLGESLGAYIQRIRLEMAASLLRYSKLEVQDVAFQVGYESPAAFNKAFKRRFSVTPTVFRSSKIEFKQKCNPKEQQLIMDNLTTQPVWKMLDQTDVIFVQRIGNYHKAATEAWNSVCAFAGPKGLIQQGSDFYGISYDDPSVTKAEKCRYEACIVVNQPVEPEGEIGVKQLRKGKYAVFTLTGSYNLLKNAYDYIYAAWMAESKVELDHSPVMEKYLNSPDTTPEDQLITEIWIPVK
ncbi:MAG: AraC family transcriptional regulator [Marinilabiliaceae bacterium]|nr:AraC family transcriptional regulator [Marinilabiliaceae bacterium]